ncbi:alpha/beta-hydrolase, partial [Crucibulum laeve]
ASPIGTSVTLDYATLTGLRNETSNIIYFRGIPFADPPIGELRWRAPVSPPTRQLGNIDTSSFANTCIATTQQAATPGTSEDCLFGNVNIPVDTRIGDKLPVMVWFHGGGFQSGSTHDAPPDFLIQASTQPMIFVSFEYRLGQFGFLGGSQIKGNGTLNAGLLDQRAALRWVRRYIGNFGGDANRVTIWGESAGAGSTMFQLIANSGNNEGLFHAAMGDSPSLSFVPGFSEPYVENIFMQFASFAGCGNLGEQTLACLRSASTATLTLAGSQTIAARPATLFVFAPIMDGEFIRERPVEAFASGDFAMVPVLFGSNTNEGANWSASLKDASANTSMPNATEQTVFNFIRGQYPNFTEAAFMQGTSQYAEQNFNDSFSLQGQQMYGEARYICTAELITAAMRKKGVPAFQFHYDNPNLGSNHGSDLMAFFSPPPNNANADDVALFTAMQEYWTSFVTTRQPTAQNSPIWVPVSNIEGGPRLLLRPGQISMEEEGGTLSAHCSFWHGMSEQIR